MDDNPSKGVKIDPNSVTLLKSSAIALGVSGDAWQIFLSKVSAIAPGAAGLTKDRFMIIMLLDNKTRDGRIVRASTGGKWGPGYKASLKRDVEKIIADSI